MVPNFRVIRQYRADQGHGQALAEFALILPVLAVIFLSILQFVMVFQAQVGLTNAAREVARNASAKAILTSTAAQDASNAYYARMAGAGGVLTRNVTSYDGARLVTTGDPKTRVCYFSYADANGTTSVMASVEIQYRHPLIIPLVGAIIDGFDGAVDGGLRVGTREDIRVSNLLTDVVSGISGPASPVCNA